MTSTERGRLRSALSLLIAGFACSFIAIYAVSVAGASGMTGSLLAALGLIPALVAVGTAYHRMYARARGDLNFKGAHNPAPTLVVLALTVIATAGLARAGAPQAAVGAVLVTGMAIAGTLSVRGRQK